MGKTPLPESFASPGVSGGLGDCVFMFLMDEMYDEYVYIYLSIYLSDLI